MDRKEESQIDVIRWIDLSHALQERILQDMSASFGKRLTDPLRFFRPSCLVWLYRESSCSPGYSAVAITFRLGGALYLDKFFVVPQNQGQSQGKRKGTGKRFFSEWAIQLRGSPVRWRTDPILATHFYGKHPAVWTIMTHGDYIYQGMTRTPDNMRSMEDIYEWLRLPSAFS